jgi:hypothetical protein
MKLNFTKQRNMYNKNYYNLDVQITGKWISEQQFEQIKTGMNLITEVLKPRIDKEEKAKKEKGK